MKLFKINKSNDRETVLKNTYALNELCIKKILIENLRSQFVGTSLLYIKDLVKRRYCLCYQKEFVDSLKEMWSLMTPKGIRGAIEGVLSGFTWMAQTIKQRRLELLRKCSWKSKKVTSIKNHGLMDILETIILNFTDILTQIVPKDRTFWNMFFIAL